VTAVRGWRQNQTRKPTRPTRESRREEQASDSFESLARHAPQKQRALDRSRSQLAHMYSSASLNQETPHISSPRKRRDPQQGSLPAPFRFPAPIPDGRRPPRATLMATNTSAKKRRTRLEEEGGEEELVDCISSLPDAVVGDILISLLLTKDNGRTRVLSSRWRDLWPFAPLNPGQDPDVNDTGKHLSAGEISRILSAHQGPQPPLQCPAWLHQRRQPHFILHVLSN